MCFYQDDYAEFQTDKLVKCRKPHRCKGCNKTIAVGQIAMSHAGKFDGDFYHYYECENCQRLTLSIAAKEIREGCSWDVAWCPIDELHNYRDMTPLLEGTLEECWKQVNDIWKAAVLQRA